MKKTIAILLLLSTLLCLFSACKEDPPAQTPDTTPPRDDTVSDNLPAKNMEHFELRILTNPPDVFDWAEVTLAPDDYSGEAIYDEMYERNAYIMERFTCEIAVTQREGTTFIYPSEIQNFAMSGDSATNPHIVMYYDKQVLGSAQYFLDWSDVPYVSLGEEYWNPDVSSLFNIRDTQVALSGSFSLGVQSITMVYLFNKAMYHSYYGDVSSMYGYVTNNEWTVDKLYTLAKGVVENPDEIWDSTDQFGIDSPYKRLYTSLMIGSDVRFVKADEDGLPFFSLPNDSYAQEKLAKLLKLCQDYDVHYTTATTVHEHDPLHSFENGKSLFAVKALFDIPAVRAEMEQEFGILPAPKYDSDQKEFRNISFAAEMACLLNTVKESELENIGIIMEALSFDSHQNLIPLYKDKLLKTRFASDEDSRAMLDIIFNTTVFELGVNVFENIISVPLIQKVYMPKKDVISSTLSGMSSVRTEIVKLVSNIK